MKKIINGILITPYRMLEGNEIAYEGNKIVEIGENIQGDFEEIIDAKGMYVTPGFVDLHVHGGVGYNFASTDKEAIKKAALMHAQKGSTTIFPTISLHNPTITDEDWSILGALNESCKESDLNKTGPTIEGIHTEGPFIGRIFPDIPTCECKKEIYEPLVEKTPYLKIVTVAPETKGIKDAVRYFTDHNIYTSAGHCDNPNYDEFMELVELGTNQVTHLYSSTKGVYRVNGARYPGLNESSLMCDDVYVEIIGDSIHLTPRMMEYVYRNKSASKVCLATDCHPTDKTFAKGEKPLEIMEIAGNTAIITYAAMDFLVGYVANDTNIPLIDAVKMATINPARACGINNHKGTLAIGQDADILIFGDDVEMKYVVARGETILKNL